MKYRIAVGVLLVVSIFMSVMWDARRVGALSWEKSSVVRHDAYPIEWKEYCGGVVQLISVNGQDRNGCTYGSRRQVATYRDENDVFRVAVKRGVGEIYHPVAGMCSSGLVCMYSETADTLITQQNGAYRKKYVVSYQNFLSQLTLTVENNAKEYVFSGESPPSFLRAVDDSLLPTQSAGISENGKWLVVELVDMGIVTVNLESGRVIRVTEGMRQYGLGRDPKFELTINNDGTAVVMAGFNVGFQIIATTDGCGHTLLTYPTERFDPSVKTCQAADADIHEVIRNTYALFNPHFDSTGDFMTIDAMSVVGLTNRVVIGDKNTTQSQIVHYVSLGDSFTSGEGETDDSMYLAGTNTIDDRCHLSNRSYPFLLATAQLWSHQAIACSGARMHDISGGGRYLGQNNRLDKKQDIKQRQQLAYEQAIPGRVRQIEFVNRLHPLVVSVSIGGNDSGILAKLKDCAGPGECSWVQERMRKSSADEIDALAQQYASLFSQLKETRAHVIVIGYPFAIDPKGKCDVISGMLFTESERRYLYESTKRLNRVMANAAAKQSLPFVDVGAAFKGAELCSDAKNSAMNGLRYGSEVSVAGMAIIGSESYHPTPKGHRMVAQAIADVMNTHQYGCRVSCRGSDEDYWKTTSVSNTIIRSWAMTDSCDQPSCFLTIPQNIFKADTMVTFISDGANEIMQAPTDDRGSVSVELVVSEASVSGYERIRATGFGVDGDALELYQVIERPVPITKEAFNDLPSETSMATNGQIPNQHIVATPHHVVTNDLKDRLRVTAFTARSDLASIARETAYVPSKRDSVDTKQGQGQGLGHYALLWYAGAALVGSLGVFSLWRMSRR